MKTISLSILALLLLALSSCNSSSGGSNTGVDPNTPAPQATGDSVWIIRMDPYEKLADGQEATFFITLGSKLVSQDTALISVFFNDSTDASSLYNRRSLLVENGQDTTNILVTTTVRDWGASGRFMALVTMSKLNSPFEESLSSDFRNIFPKD